MPVSFPKRGEIYLVDLNPVIGSEQGGYRPVLIIQNDVSNQYSPVVIVASITSAPARVANPVDVLIVEPGDTGLRPSARILLNQIKTIDKRRLSRYIGQLDPDRMQQVDHAIQISLGLVPL
jgi:mRNA interferase MazF